MSFHRDEVISKMKELLEVLVCTQAADWARQGALQYAEAFLRPLTKDSNASPLTLDLMARILAQQGRWKEARELWERALAQAPNDDAFQKAIQRCSQMERKFIHPSWRPILLLVFPLAIFVGLIVLKSYVTRPHERVSSDSPEKVAVFQPVSPPNLQVKVLQGLKSNPQTRSLNITVIQDGVLIRLKGEVPNLWLRYEIERITRGCIGNKAILELRDLRSPEYYIVRKGDSLWTISRRVYGNPTQWSAIAQANALLHPYKLRIGQRLKLPQ
jgi:nucleoid-associated protein YgaU